MVALPGPLRAAPPVVVPPSGEAPGGIFLPAASGMALWSQTLATVAADWPVIHVEEPDFLTQPPRPGLIESAWVEPQGDVLQSWPPRRQRVVVRMVPTGDGAWIDAFVETQSLGDAVSGDVQLAGTWQPDAAAGRTAITPQLAAQLSPDSEVVTALPGIQQEVFLPPAVPEPPWAHSQHPRLARAGYRVLEDYRNFYSCDSLTCIAGAFGAGALMANTGFDTTMQNAWMRSVEPTTLGTFFSGCKDIGEGRYALGVFGAAAGAGLLFEGNPAGDVIGEWGSRSLRMFVVGAPPVYLLQLATGASRPRDQASNGSGWKFFQDDNGVSGHAFVGAIPFLAAADMVENPLLKGTLYVCSTFVAFSRMTDNAHYPSQVFLGWYLAWASARAVNRTQIHFSSMEVSVVPLPIGDMGGVGLEARW